MIYIGCESTDSESSIEFVAAYAFEFSICGVDTRASQLHQTFHAVGSVCYSIKLAALQQELQRIRHDSLIQAVLWNVAFSVFSSLLPPSGLSSA
jgi:hypothetical protein